MSIGRITPGVATLGIQLEICRFVYHAIRLSIKILLLEGLIYVVGGEQESKILANGEVLFAWTCPISFMITLCFILLGL